MLLFSGTFIAITRDISFHSPGFIWKGRSGLPSSLRELHVTRPILFSEKTAWEPQTRGLRGLCLPISSRLLGAMARFGVKKKRKKERKKENYPFKRPSCFDSFFGIFKVFLLHSCIMIYSYLRDNAEFFHPSLLLFNFLLLLLLFSFDIKCVMLIVG